MRMGRTEMIIRLALIGLLLFFIFYALATSGQGGR